MWGCPLQLSHVSQKETSTLLVFSILINEWVALSSKSHPHCLRLTIPSFWCCPSHPQVDLPTLMTSPNSFHFLYSSNFPVHPDVCKAANFNYLIESIFYFECLINKYSKKKSLPLIYKKNCILSNIITLHIFYVLFDWIKKMRIDNRFI